MSQLKTGLKITILPHQPWKQTPPAVTVMLPIVFRSGSGFDALPASHHREPMDPKMTQPHVTSPFTSHSPPLSQDLDLSTHVQNFYSELWKYSPLFFFLFFFLSTAGSELTHSNYLWKVDRKWSWTLKNSHWLLVPWATSVFAALTHSPDGALCRLHGRY